MPTARSSTDAAEAAWLRPVRDVGHLVRFRRSAIRRPSAYRWTVAVLLGLTAAAAVVPAYWAGSATSHHALEFRVLLPTGMAGFLGLAVISSIASGGGRELIHRDQAVAYPISPATDHLGALVLAPLNIAWLLQSWTLLVSFAYAFGPASLPTAIPVVLLWLAVSTAAGQAISWLVEAVRRQPHGIAVVRVLLGGVAGLVVWLQLSGHLSAVLDQLPTRTLVLGATDGVGWPWLETLAVEVALLVVLVVGGVLPARLAARRPPLDEARVESDAHTPQPMPRSDLGALLRVDRATVWRSVPMRRGLAVLALGPGIVSLLGDLPWDTLTIMPGLVASGGALLFGVNAWCLDGRGLLWRENLPVDPRLVFAARTLVLAEFLTVAAVATVLIASLRAGLPRPAELSALVCTVVVIVVQVVGAAMRWSEQRPFPVDLRSARATPAPPAVMVGYSSRLALSTTMTGLVFSGLSRAPDWQPAVLVAVPFVAWSSWRLWRTRQRWIAPEVRARVVIAVSA